MPSFLMFPCSVLPLILQYLLIVFLLHVQIAEGSTIIDMTGVEPLLVRMGKGDPAMFLLDSGAT